MRRGATGTETGEALTAEEVARRPLRLALFSPVPPVASGVSDYVADLIPALPPSWKVDVFVDDGVEPDDGLPGDRGGCHPHGEWEARHADRAYDLNVYQVGNHVVHAYLLDRALETPGLLVLHDAVIHPSRAQHALESGTLDEYRRATRRCRPDVGAALGHLVAGGLAGPGVYFRFPLCEDLVGASRLTAVHGGVLAAWLRAVVPGARVTSVAHWRSVAEVGDEAVRRWRRRLLESSGGEGGVLAGCFGFLGPARRLPRLLEAVAALAPRRDLRLVLAGRSDPDLAIEQRTDELGIGGRVVQTGRLDEKDFAAVMRAVDLAVNLRWPPARASSGVLHQLLRLGVPTVITDLLHWRDYPAEVVARVPPGPDEAEVRGLREVLERWSAQPERRRRTGEAARAWAARHLGPDAAAASYASAVAAALSGPGS